MGGPYYAVVAPGSPRWDAWLECFGANFVEVEAPVPHPAHSPDGGVDLFFKVKVSALSPDQLRRVLARAAAAFGLTPDEVDRDFAAGHGIPILARDVAICVDPIARGGWG